MQTDSIRITEHKLKKLNRKLLYIFFFNIIDGLLTYIGVTNNYTVEMNKLIANVVSDFSRLLIYKLLLPSVMVLFVAYIINRFRSIKMPVASLFINICFWVYVSVLLVHFYWIAIVGYNMLIS